MRIATIFGSQRQGGTHAEIEKMLTGLDLSHQFDFIRMADVHIEGCVACMGCATTGRCALPASAFDDFPRILDRLIAADVILVVTPVYTPYPSRLTALMERLLSISYYAHTMGRLERPLKGKKTAIVLYDSGKIDDETQLKMIFQRFLMDDYGFTQVDYNFINQVPNPNERYRNVIEYVKDIVTHL